MATLIPAFNTCAQRMTAGERRLAQRERSRATTDWQGQVSPVPPDGLFKGFEPQPLRLKPR